MNYSFYLKIKDHVVYYPAFTSFNYYWNFGFLLMICLVFQLITGFLLSFYYSSNIELAFWSIENFMRNFEYGWAIRYFHSNGASLFFFFIYFHIAKGFYYKSYNKILLWLSGFILFALLMAISFIGYVLPWGQMSYWGCMVITSLVTAIPLAGEYILHGLWGGQIISEITLMRAYSVHFILPFVLLALVFFHISILHIEGGSSPLGIENYDYIAFYPYLVIKDVFSFVFISLGFYLYFVFFNPNYLGDCINYIMADDIKTPVHIVPEWYFLPYYCMLRCVPHKVLGILCFLSSVLCIGLICLLPTSIIPTRYDLIHIFLFFFFF